MTKPKAAGTSRCNHYVFSQVPQFAKVIDDEKRKTVLKIVLGEMSISKRGPTKEKIEDAKKIYCEEIDKAFKLYLNPPERRYK